MPWRKLKLVHQILLLAIFALMILAGIVLHDFQRKMALDSVIHEQEQLLRIKNQLALIELETLNARLDENLLVSERNEDIFDRFENRIYMIENLSKTLQNQFRSSKTQESFQDILKSLKNITKRYKRR